MSPSYDFVNLVSSFGLSEIWRAQCVRNLELRPGDVVADFMAGSGECWRYLRRRIKPAGRIISVDICPGMCRRQERQLNQFAATTIEIRCENALSTSLREGSVDHVVSAFGLKTFDASQLARLIQEIFRILRPGGSCSLIEISVPDSRLLRTAYLFYVGWVIPLVGRIFLRNIECYQMLGVYTRAFGNCKPVANSLRAGGFRVQAKTHFFGCASSVLATKPEQSSA